MRVQLVPASPRIEVPGLAWLGAALAVLTAVGAIPVGIMFLTDPTGASVGLPDGWIEGTVFGDYTVPGLYLLLANGLGMLLVALLTWRRHWSAPWLMGALGVGLIIWIAVQVVVMPEVFWLQAVYGTFGVALGLIALAWLRQTGQLRAW